MGRITDESPYVVSGQPSISVDAIYLETLQKDSEFLECLTACGVDSWDGFEEALEMYEEESAA